MTDNTDESPSQVDELLVEYMDRLDRDERVVIEEFLNQHPEHADELRELIEADKLLGQLNAPDTPATLLPTIVPVVTPATRHSHPLRRRHRLCQCRLQDNLLAGGSTCNPSTTSDRRSEWLLSGNTLVKTCRLKAAPVRIIRSSSIPRKRMSSACRYGVRDYGGISVHARYVGRVYGTMSETHGGTGLNYVAEGGRQFTFLLARLELA